MLGTSSAHRLRRPHARRVRVGLGSLGCKVNQAETDDLARQLAQEGLWPVGFNAAADAYVINSCTVTHWADRKSRQLVGQARRANPQALVVVTGCYATVAPEEVRALAGVGLLVSNDDKPCLAPLLREALGLSQEGRAAAMGWRQRRTRAFLKVQEGCNHGCAYCIVPRARGRERSLPLEEAVAAVQAQVAAGCKEVVLAGVQLGAYGRDLQRAAPKGGRPDWSLAQLVRAVLGRTAVPRLRLSSLEPEYFDPALLGVWGHPRLCRHIHLPLQSGSDTLLRRMGRRYTTAQFAELVGELRAKVPDAAITTDIIVGFPGETEAEFAASYAFAQKMRFSYIHVFRFSPRRGTRAAAMAGQLAPEVIRQRAEAMRALAAESRRDFYRGFIGQQMPVLYEGQGGTSPGGARLWEGLTDNYLRVVTPSTARLTNEIRWTRLTAAEETLVGELLS